MTAFKTDALPQTASRELELPYTAPRILNAAALQGLAFDEGVCAPFGIEGKGSVAASERESGRVTL